jgi:hypothetical protein
VDGAWPKNTNKLRVIVVYNNNNNNNRAADMAPMRRERLPWALKLPAAIFRSVRNRVNPKSLTCAPPGY